MGRILVGTTSWTEKTLLDSGLFYPASARTPEARLRYYAEQFPVVEVDSSYYGLPSERNSVLWAKRTPPGFVFDVKAFRIFTLHQTPLRALPAEVREVLGTLESKDKKERKNVYYDDLPAGPGSKTTRRRARWSSSASTGWPTSSSTSRRVSRRAFPRSGR